MTNITPSQEWWTAEEIAAGGLADLPATRQGVDALLKKQGWRSDPEHARRRAGRGGGWEYHWRLFPSRAQRQLLLHAKGGPEPVARQSRDEAWAWYDALPQAVKDKALIRLELLQQVEALEPALGRYLAVETVARSSAAGERTLWSWLALIEGVRPDDRLPYLAPRHRAAARRGRSLDCDPEFFDLLKSDYLRLAGFETEAKTRAEAEILGAVEAAVAAGKIAPASKEYHLASCRAEGGLERFRAMIGSAPSITAPSGADRKDPPGAEPALSAEELAMCRQFNMTPEAFALAKKE